MYLFWNEKTISDFSDQTINNLYNHGYLFTRKDKGVMQQTRSLRINLSKFKLSSENRRILKKNELLILEPKPIPYSNYQWTIGKMGKDFYTTKFGDGTFSANKIKELVTDSNKSNFDRLFVYLLNTNEVGYSICKETNEVLHYCYPFYSLQTSLSSLGLGMMLKAILHIQEQGKKYIYLGSAQRPSDTYKLQFDGLEWFDGKEWKTNLEELKDVLKKLDTNPE